MNGNTASYRNGTVPRGAARGGNGTRMAMGVKKGGGIVLLHFAVAILHLPFYNLLRSLSYAIHSWSLIHG